MTPEQRRYPHGILLRQSHLVDRGLRFVKPTDLKDGGIRQGHMRKLPPALADEIREWIETNVRGGCQFRPHDAALLFSDERDAVLFKTFWL